MLVVDASVAFEWISPDAYDAHPAVKALDALIAAEEELVAPGLLLLEISNGLLTGVRSGRWSGPQADDARDVARGIPVRIDDDSRDVERAWEVARRSDNHPVYDMVYAAMAERNGTRLLTSDRRLIRALDRTGLALRPEEVIA